MSGVLESAPLRDQVYETQRISLKRRFVSEPYSSRAALAVVTTKNISIHKPQNDQSKQITESENNLSEINLELAFSFSESPPLRVRSSSKNYASLTIPELSPSPCTEDSVSPQTINDPTPVEPPIPTQVSSIPEHEITILSNGKIGNCQFPQLESTSLTQRGPSTGSFDIETDSSGVVSGSLRSIESIIPGHFFEQSGGISPNVPSIAEIGPKPRLRQTILNERNFFSNDSFQDYLEERLARFRPNESQHNTQVSEGKHPYFSKEIEKRGTKEKGRLFDWFTGSKPVPDIEKQLDVSTEGSNIFFTAQEPLDQMDLALQNLRCDPSSSNSILPILQPTHLSDPYTPYAMPFPDDLRQQERFVRGEGSALDSMEEILDLVNGTENFITSCTNKQNIQLRRIK
ncbi:hypothetical protein PSN45_001015 [Yamadazyma tenuis]|uniref:uncharacterized protein n=1 Tax=Candida tenuis TaxID=2315449 RepID=UPI0027A8A31F|nr:hypothetical protein PSN45_001015 [Yamadazyma tenuis]